MARSSGFTLSIKPLGPSTVYRRVVSSYAWTVHRTLAWAGGGLVMPREAGEEDGGRDAVDCRSTTPPLSSTLVPDIHRHRHMEGRQDERCAKR